MMEVWLFPPSLIFPDGGAACFLLLCISPVAPPYTPQPPTPPTSTYQAMQAQKPQQLPPPPMPVAPPVPPTDGTDPGASGQQDDEVRRESPPRHLSQASIWHPWCLIRLLFPSMITTGLEEWAAQTRKGYACSDGGECFGHHDIIIGV